MDTLVRMNAEEINISFIDFVKTSFKGKKIALHIYEEDIDETEYLLKSDANKKRLFESIENVKSNIKLHEIDHNEMLHILNDDGK
jgi:antitoxin YefM